MSLLGKYRRMWNYPEGRAKLLRMGALGVFVSLVGLFLLTTVVFAIFSVGLPDPNKVVRREGYSTILYDRNGKVLYDVYDKENRIPLDLADIPKYMQEATISIEDKEFYSHGGFSVTGIVRSLLNIVTLHGLSGGSTLTQQLVKNLLLTPEQSVVRKIKEIILAREIEKKFTKDQILQMYLNEAPYGGAIYGVESASRNYFGKDAKDLTLVESAILAGIPQDPPYYSPIIGKPKAYESRAKDVLRRMREDGYISSQQEVDAGKQLDSVNFASQSGSLKAAHFVFYVKDLLKKKFGDQMVESGGLRVTTTLDADLQSKAEDIVKAEVTKIKPLKVSNGAAMVMDPKTGEILSMIGSYDYFDKDYGSYNVTTALRQPGSSGKPFVYATALMKGYTASTMLMDAKTEYPAGEQNGQKKFYTPENYDGKYRGPMQLRFALGNSINTIAVKLTALVGLSNIMKTGFDAGISTWEPTQDNLNRVGLSLALGGQEVQLLELTSAYGTFANGGVREEPVAILKVTDSKGNVLFENREVTGKRVFSPEVSFIISHILSDNNARKDVFGDVNLLQVPGKTVAAKTGTTDLKRDNWTLGYTPSRVVGVWVGNNDNTVMAPAITSGVTGAAPIWNKIMRAALADMPNEDFKKPDGVDAVQIDSFGGGLPYGDSPTRTEYYIKGTAPVGPAPVYKKLKISKANNSKLANDIEVQAGQYDEKDYYVVKESDPVSTDGKNRWQDAINAWIDLNKKDDPKWHPPTEKSDANQNTVIIQIDTPTDKQRIDSNDVHVKAHAFGAHDVVKFTVSVDGSEKINKNSDSVDENLSMSSGVHKVKFHAEDSAGNSSDVENTIGVNANWDSAPPATSSANFIPSTLP